MISSRGNLPGLVTPNEKQPSKLAKILRLLTRGVSLNRFEAENHHDHCLHSTVSALQNNHGILIDRMTETVPCLHGKETTRVKRYWLERSLSNIKAATLLLDKLGAK